MKSGEALYRFCFYDNFVSSKKLKELTIRTGDAFEDEYNDEEVLFLAQKIHRLVNDEEGITHHHFYAILKNEGRKKLTKTKQQFLKGMLMYHCLKIQNDLKCLTCGKDIITVNVRKNFLKMILKKKIPAGNRKVKIQKCGCGEYLKVKGISSNYTQKL